MIIALNVNKTNGGYYIKKKTASKDIFRLSRNVIGYNGVNCVAQVLGKYLAKRFNPGGFCAAASPSPARPGIPLSYALVGTSPLIITLCNDKLLLPHPTLPVSGERISNC